MVRVTNLAIQNISRTVYTNNACYSEFLSRSTEFTNKQLACSQIYDFGKGGNYELLYCHVSVELHAD